MNMDSIKPGIKRSKSTSSSAGRTKNRQKSNSFIFRGIAKILDHNNQVVRLVNKYILHEEQQLLLAKTLTAVAAKPIAATMTRTASTSGYELGLLAAAGSLTIIPGAIVIYFVRNYIAKGFALGRV